MNIEEIMNHFSKAKRQSDSSFLVICPSHADRNPSLHISQEDDKILLKCHAGCDTKSICNSLGLELSDLFITKPPLKKEVATKDRKIVATYSYTDESEKELFQVVRFEPKGFSQRHRNGNGEWVWALEGVRRVLYHLPEILIEPDTIYLVEGEKDADKLWEYGQVATTSPGGSSNWKPEYANYLKGKKVIIIPDNDLAGLSYARAAATSLQKSARDVKCVLLPDGIKDFSEWIIDRDILEIKTLERDISVLFEEEKLEYRLDGDIVVCAKDDFIIKAESIRQEKTGVHARISIFSNYQMVAWSSFNIERSEDRTRLANQVKRNDESIRRILDLFCSGLWEFYISSFMPEIMVGSDDDSPPEFFLYPYIVKGGGSILFSVPGKGKSYSSLIWAQSINCGISTFWQVIKTPVLFINLERSASSIKKRLGAVNQVLGLKVDQSLLVFNARGKSLAEISQSVKRAVNQYGIGLIILDSVSRAGFGDLTENKPVNAIIDMLSGLCESWLALAHSPRASEDRVYGSVMLDAGADIIIQLKSQSQGNKLGLAYDITKKNDLPDIPTRIWCLEFSEWRIKSLRQAESYEFDEIESQKKVNMIDTIKEFIFNTDSGDATATQIEHETGYNRVNISRALNQSGEFIKTRKDKASQYYGVLELHEH